MFYGEEYNVPPCCDQKYFGFLWKELQEHPITMLWMQADYSLQQVLAKVLLHVPMSTMSLMVPELSDMVLDVLLHALARPWYGGGDDKHQLERLTLILPESYIDADRRQAITEALAPFKERVTIALNDTPSTIIHITNNSSTYAFTGTTHQHPHASKQYLTALTATCDHRLCKEIQTVLRLQSHHKLK